jgi:hypothetical protein
MLVREESDSDLNDNDNQLLLLMPFESKSSNEISRLKIPNMWKRFVEECQSEDGLLFERVHKK